MLKQQYSLVSFRLSAAQTKNYKMPKGNLTKLHQLIQIKEKYNKGEQANICETKIEGVNWERWNCIVENLLRNKRKNQRLQRSY